jgi:hypothetical protein
MDHGIGTGSLADGTFTHGDLRSLRENDKKRARPGSDAAATWCGNPADRNALHPAGSGDGAKMDETPGKKVNASMRQNAPITDPVGLHCSDNAVPYTGQ